MIAEINDEICRLRNTITYCEWQIMRKQIALIEFLEHGIMDVKQDKPTEPEVVAEPKPERERVKTPSNGMSLREMIQNVIPELPRVFWYKDVKNALIQKYPDQAPRIKRGLHTVCGQMVTRTKEILKVPGGFSKA